MKEFSFPKLRLISPIMLAVGLLICTPAAFQLSGHQTAYAAQAASPLDVVISEIDWMGTAVSAYYATSESLEYLF
jgi:hypothetical protein